MIEEKVTTATISDIENLYEKRKEEYQKTKDIKNRLEATKDVNMNEFKKMYEQLDPSLINTYGLQLEKQIEELSVNEIEEMSHKLDSAFNDITAKLSSYLRTGKTEDLGDLIVKEEVNESDKSIKLEEATPLTVSTEVSREIEENLDVFRD